MAVRFSGNKYSSISFPPRKRAHRSRRDVTKITKRGRRHVLFHRLRGEVDARVLVAPKSWDHRILNFPVHPTFTYVQQPMWHDIGGSLAVTFSRSSIPIFPLCGAIRRTWCTSRHRSLKKYLLDHPRAEFLRVWRRGFRVKRKTYVYAPWNYTRAMKVILHL